MVLFQRQLLALVALNTRVRETKMYDMAVADKEVEMLTCSICRATGSEM